MWFVEPRSGVAKCRELSVSVQCPVSVHPSTLSIKRAVYRTKSANISRDYTETDISRRVMELCPGQSTCRFDLAARDVTPVRTTQRAGRHYGNHIDISYKCQSSASAMIQPTNYLHYRPTGRPTVVLDYLTCWTKSHFPAGILAHSCLFAQTPMYNVNRIMRNAGQKGHARHLYNCPKIKTIVKLKYSALH